LFAAWAAPCVQIARLRNEVAKMQTMKVQAAGQQMAAILGLTGSPIGVRLLAPGQGQPEGHCHSEIIATARR
jgi:uncharacterized protein (DUF169 family)